MSRVHPTAAAGFTKPDVYERGRPGYPPEAVDALELRAGLTVVDLGCGTGKLTRSLAQTAASVIGVEPLQTMLSTFRGQLPHVKVAAGLAEAIPLRDSCADLVVCAAAFHWFSHDRALPEIHRVLRDGGRLAIVWNRRDELTGWAADFWAITEVYRQDTPGYRSGAWRAAVDSSPLFGPLSEQRFSHVQVTDLDGLIARVASISFIGTLPDDERARVLVRSRTFIESHPDTHGRTSFELPYSTALYVTRAV